LTGDATPPLRGSEIYPRHTPLAPLQGERISSATHISSRASPAPRIAIATHHQRHASSQRHASPAARIAIGTHRQHHSSDCAARLTQTWRHHPRFAPRRGSYPYPLPHSPRPPSARQGRRGPCRRERSAQEAGVELAWPYICSFPPLDANTSPCISYQRRHGAQAQASGHREGQPLQQHSLQQQPFEQQPLQQHLLQQLLLQKQPLQQQPLQQQPLHQQPLQQQPLEQQPLQQQPLEQQPLEQQPLQQQPLQQQPLQQQPLQQQPLQQQPLQQQPLQLQPLPVQPQLQSQLPRHHGGSGVRAAEAITDAPCAAAGEGGEDEEGEGDSNSSESESGEEGDQRHAQSGSGTDTSSSDSSSDSESADEASSEGEAEQSACMGQAAVAETAAGKNDVTFDKLFASPAEAAVAAVGQSDGYDMDDEDQRAMNRGRYMKIGAAGGAAGEGGKMKTRNGGQRQKAAGEAGDVRQERLLLC
ncbi:hypothetical protein CLOP_g16762, partial [Closterium sp. NIES-67]